MYPPDFPVGAGAGEREQDKGVNVDDGTETVGTVDQLVHQTTYIPLCL